MISCIYKGKVLDWKFKQIGNDNWHYAFYVGNILVGQVFRIKKRNWSAVSDSPKEFNSILGLCPIYGFGSRRAAAEFLIKLSKFKGH